MYRNILLAMVAAFTAAAASAQLVVVTQNYTDDPMVLPAILDSNGVPLPNGGGFVGVGTFTIGDVDIQNLLSHGNVSEVFEAWRQHGAAGVMAGVGGGIDGFFQIASQANSTASGVGTKTVYTVISNTATPDALSELLIFRHDAVFPLVEVPSVSVLNVFVVPGAGTLVWGGLGNYQFDVVNLGPEDAYNTRGAIPEPSAYAMLVGLGALGVVANRRRR